MACRKCRARKIKCDRARPVCKNCLQRNTLCVYAGERSKRRKLNDSVTPFTGTYRFVEHVAGGSKKTGRSLRSQVVPEAHNAAHSISTEAHNSAQSISTEAHNAAHSISTVSQASECDTHETGMAVCNAEEHMPGPLPPISEGTCSSTGREERSEYHSPLQLQLSGSHEGEDSSGLVDRLLNGYDSDCLLDRNPAVWIRSEDGGEYTGPSSGLACISDLNLRWLQAHLPGSEALYSTLKNIRSGILSHLRQPKCIATEMWPSPETPAILKPLPPVPEIRKYVDAYFSRVQVVFPILDRARFEARLLQYHQGQVECTGSWKALLNAVIASGLRAALSDETAEAFQLSGREAWGYFRNALCYETQLVHGETDLMAVQALVVMAIFAQGMSSPQRLEYTLSSTASRLAHGLALNLHPPTEWNISESEQLERNRTFWVIYCLDRTIALRTGRPASIRDEEISCLFPRNISISQESYTNGTLTSLGPIDEAAEFDFFLTWTKFSNICNKITKGFYSAVALCRPSIDLLPTAQGIMSDLETWRLSIPTDLRPGQSFSRIPALSYGSRQRLLTLHFSYNYAICAVYRRFMPMFTDRDKEQHEAVKLSIHSNPTTAIEAARSMVLLTKQLDIESFAPGWLVFYYPMTALTIIFMHVVCNPLAATTSNDIALMDAVVGFFGRLEFVTSGEAAFTQMGEFVQQARRIVANSREEAARQQGKSQSPNLLQNEFLSITSPSNIAHDGEIVSDDSVHNSVTHGSESHCTVFSNYAAVPHESSQPNADKPSHQPENIPLISNVTELAVSIAGGDQGREGLLKTAEQFRQSFTHSLEQPILGVFPNSPSDVNWLDAWMSPRQTEGLAYDAALQSWT